MNLKKYPGEELEYFKYAKNWKKYWSVHLRKEINGVGAEIGSGLSTNLEYIFSDKFKKFYCIEPDKKNHSLAKKRDISEFKNKIEFINSDIEWITTNSMDIIFYIDVLEHIENDRLEVELINSKLKVGGYLCILVPAHQFLYSNFDKAIGHYRRYNKRTLATLRPHNFIEERMYYLDSIGLFAAILNKYFFKQDLPSQRTILLWDNYFIPISKFLDKLLNYSLGKSLICIWKKYEN